MKLKMPNQKKSQEERLLIGTHSGIYQPDEVVAVAILCLYNQDKKVEIIRSRDMDILKACHILVDIGEGEFDHHQPGGNGQRENGIPYASCGLVWNKFGEEVIRKIYFSIPGLKIKENCEMYKILKEEIDRNIISIVDAEDNGKYLENDAVNLENNHLFSYINTSVPVWYLELDYDKAFKKVLKTTIRILEQIILKEIEKFVAGEEIRERCKYVYDAELDRQPYLLQNILELPNERIPWIEEVVKFNNDNVSLDKDIINFVIFPCTDGGWAAQAVPPSLEKKFEQKISFPKEWAGQTLKLPEISGVGDATFCHNELFLVRAKSKEGVKALCAAAVAAMERS